MKRLTRRELFSELFSRDMLKNVVGAWQGFNKEVSNASEISCEDAGIMLGRKARKSFDGFFKNKT